MSIEEFNWGLIGPGRIAHNFACALKVVKHAKLYAVASRDRQRASDFSAQYNGEKSYGDYQQLLADPNIDAIYIGTPHRFHYEQIKLGLNAGKAVLCEKPLTVNATQAAELIDLAKQKQVFLMEAVWTRFLPIYDEVSRWLNQNLIGDLHSIQSSFGFKIEKNDNDRLYNPRLAGGSLLDMGVYNVNISQWVFKQNPINLSSTATIADTGVDEHCAVNLMYADKRYSQFTSSFLAKHNNDLSIYGSKGKIIIHDMFWCAQSASLITEEDNKTINIPFRASGFEYEIEAAIEAIKNGELEHKIMPLNDTLANMKVMDEIRRIIGLEYCFTR